MNSTCVCSPATLRARLFRLTRREVSSVTTTSIVRMVSPVSPIDQYAFSTFVVCARIVSSLIIVSSMPRELDWHWTTSFVMSLNVMFHSALNLSSSNGVLLSPSSSFASRCYWTIFSCMLSSMIKIRVECIQECPFSFPRLSLCSSSFDKHWTFGLSSPHKCIHQCPEAFFMFGSVLLEPDLKRFFSLNQWLTAIIVRARATAVSKGITFNKRKSRCLAQWMDLFFSFVRGSRFDVWWILLSRSVRRWRTTVSLPLLTVDQCIHHDASVDPFRCSTLCESVLHNSQRCASTCGDSNST